jgi:biotin carboxyl carrier protein
MIYEVSIGEKTREIDVTAQGEGYMVRVGDSDPVFVDVRAPANHVLSVLCDGFSYEAGVKGENHSWKVDIYGTTHEVDVQDPRSKALRLAGGADQGLLKTAMPGRVVRLLVAKGQAVSKGDPIIVVEAMKMENEMKAPADGCISEIFVAEGQAIEAGASLILVE